MRAALYCRVSTEAQAERYGLGSQERALRQRAQERGYTLVADGREDAFVDNGYSGGDLDRPALSRLRRALIERGVDVLLCYDPDRLSRNLSDLLLLANEVEGQGARLEFITQETDSSPEGKMFFAIRGAVAEYEKNKIRERTARGRLEKARQGKLVNPGNLPYGYTYSRDTGKVEVDQERAQVVKLAFSLVVEDGMTLKGVARRFTQLGIRTPSGGSNWVAPTVQLWLRNPAYRGDYLQLRYESVEPQHRRKPLGHNRKSSSRLRPADEWHHLAVPPVVSPEAWQAAQQRLERNKVLSTRNAQREYLLQGLVRCGQCGARLVGWYRTLCYYRCSRYGRSRSDVKGQYCERRPVRADSLEEAVWGTVSRLLEDPEVLVAEVRRRREEGSPTRELLQQELSACRRRLGEIPQEQTRLVEGYGKGLVPDGLMGERMVGLRQESEELKDRVQELEHRWVRLEVSQTQEEAVRAFADKVGQGIANLDFAGKREVLRLVVEDITVGQEEALVRTIIPLGANQDEGKVPLRKGHRERHCRPLPGAGQAELESPEALLLRGGRARALTTCCPAH